MTAFLGSSAAVLGDEGGRLLHLLRSGPKTSSSPNSPTYKRQILELLGVPPKST